MLFTNPIFLLACSLIISQFHCTNQTTILESPPVKAIITQEAFESTLLSDPTLQTHFWASAAASKVPLSLNPDLADYFSFFEHEDGEQLCLLLERSVSNASFSLRVQDLLVLAGFKCNKPLYKFFNLAFGSNVRWQIILQMIKELDLAACGDDQLKALFEAVEKVFAAKTGLADILSDLICLVAVNEGTLLATADESLKFSYCLVRLLSFANSGVYTSKDKLSLWERLFEAAPQSGVHVPFTHLHPLSFQGFWMQMSYLSKCDKEQVLKLMAGREKAFKQFCSNFTHCMINLLVWTLERPESPHSPNSKSPFLIPLRNATRKAFLEYTSTSKDSIGAASALEVASKLQFFSLQSAPHFAIALLLEPDSQAIFKFLSSITASYTETESKFNEFASVNNYAVLESLFRIAEASNSTPCSELDWYFAFVKIRLSASKDSKLFRYLDQGIKTHLKPFNIHYQYNATYTLGLNAKCSASRLDSPLHTLLFSKAESDASASIGAQFLETPPILLKRIEINDNFISSMLNSRLTSIAMYMLVILLFVLMHRVNVAIKAWKERRHIKKTESIV